MLGIIQTDCLYRGAKRSVFAKFLVRASGWVYLLAGDFTKMVLMAIVIALLISYYLTRSWLQDFACRISLQWWYFIGDGLAALCIAWITVSLAAFMVCMLNPVNSLKSE